MKIGHLIPPMIHLLVVMLIGIIGVFLLILPYAETLRFFVADLLIHNTQILTVSGSIFCIFGLMLFVGFSILHRRQFLRVKMGTSTTIIEESIIRDYIKLYWKELFPKHVDDIEILIHPLQKLEVIAKLPLLEEEEKEKILSRIQNELGVLLARKLGYTKPFFLMIQEG